MMANLLARDKYIIEKLFGMESGYVMDFSNPTFERFIADAINIDIYAGEGYKEYSSKANKLRLIFRRENDQVVGTLLNELLGHCEDMKVKSGSLTDGDKWSIEQLKVVATRLVGNVTKLSIPNEQEDDTLKTLSDDINSALSRNAPTLVLDRLHTFATKLLRQICIENNISVADSKGNNYPLQSLAGMLKNHFQQNNVLKSEFVPLAIQNNIILFDRFNMIRNDQSYAHDNEVLGNIEAEYVVKTMINTLSFIDAIERQRKAIEKDSRKGEFEMPI
jgi:hypothetical protein